MLLCLIFFVGLHVGVKDGVIKGAMDSNATQRSAGDAAQGKLGDGLLRVLICCALFACSNAISFCIFVGLHVGVKDGVIKGAIDGATQRSSRRRITR